MTWWRRDGFCIHCLPIITRSSHRGERFVSSVESLARQLAVRCGWRCFGLVNSAKLASAMERICAQALLGLLRACGLARFTAIKERKSIFNRSLVVIDEASRRGYGTRVLRLCGRETHYFELCAGRAIHFRGLPLADGQALSGIPFGIIEANSLPYIDMHHFPVTGAPRNVAGAILDEVERRYCEG